MSDLTSNWGPGTAEVGIAQAKGKNASTDAANDEDGARKISAGKIRDLFNRGSKVLRPEQRAYWLARAAVRGEQWVYWDRQRDKITELPRDDRVRVTVNKLGPATRSLFSKANKRPLTFEAIPQGPDDKSVLAARLQEAVIEDCWREQNWENLRSLEWLARWEGGTGIVSVDWDPQAGTILGHDDDSDEDYGTGDIKVSVCSIAECCTEPGERDIEHARWWIKVTTMPPHKAKDIYRLAELPPADATMALSPFQTQVMSTDNRQVQVPMTLVLTYYERPSFTCPDGQVAVVCGNNVVKWATWPFPFKDRLNVACFREMPVIDRWNGDTILWSAQPVQVGYNASWSSILEHLKQASNARLAVPDTSIDSLDELTDNPGEMFFYNPAGPAPSYMAPPNMPNWWVQMPELLDAALQDILAWHEVNNSQAPANLESGLGLSILGEGDDAPMARMIKETAEGWSRVADMVLRIYAAKVKETRKARVEGPGQAPQVVSWKGGDLGDDFDIRVPIDAIMPVSEAAAHARAQALWDRHIITDPKLYAKVAQLPYARDLIAALDPDQSRAQRENLDLSNGCACVPAMFDDHAKHIAAHNDYRKSEAYEHLDNSPTVPLDGRKIGLKDLVDLHVQAHETMAAEAAGKQLAQQMVHPALGQAPNSTGQQPVVDGAPATPPMAGPPQSLQAPPPAAPEPDAGVGPAAPEIPGQ